MPFSYDEEQSTRAPLARYHGAERRLLEGLWAATVHPGFASRSGETMGTGRACRKHESCEVICLRVDDPAAAPDGSVLIDFHVRPSAKTMWTIAVAREAFGLPARGTLDARELVGRACRVKVGTFAGDTGQVTTVNSILPPEAGEASRAEEEQDGRLAKGAQAFAARKAPAKRPAARPQADDQADGEDGDAPF